MTCEYKNISNMSKTNSNSSSWVKPLLNWTCTFLFTLQNIKSSFKERATQCSHLKRQLFWKWVICHLNHFSLQDNHSKITSDLFRSEGHHFQMVHPVWIWRGWVGHRKCVEMHIPTPHPLENPIPCSVLFRFSPVCVPFLDKLSSTKFLNLGEHALSPLFIPSRLLNPSLL